MCSYILYHEIKDKIRSTKTSLSYSANTFITSEERNLSIMNRITCPKSYVIQRFHCIMCSESLPLCVS